MKMKSLLLALTFAVGFLFSAKAEKASLFQYDKNAVNTQLQQVNKVENYVTEHPGTTLSQMKSENSSLVQNLNLNSTTNFSSMADGPLGIPSFLWGCVLGVVGILIVYLITQDTDETKKALYGCLVWTLVWIFWWVFVVAIGGGSFLFF